MTRSSPNTNAKRPAWRDPVIGMTVCAAIVQVAVVWTPGLPLGVPGEWTWGRIPYGWGEAAALFLSLFVAVPAAVAYWWFCRAGARRVEAPSPVRWVWLAGLAACGFGWLWIAQESFPGEIHRLGRAPFVQYYPSLSGYFTKARQANDLDQFLADYETLMAEGDVLHIGTHPPGLIVAHWTLLRLYESSPALTRLTLATRPRSVRETESLLQTMPSDDGTVLPDSVLAELWAFSLIVQFAAAATVIPLFFVASSTAGPVAAWRTAALWPLVPALAAFLPKSDAIYPLIGLGVLALWHGPAPPGALRAALAGVVFWLGMTLSLAVLPVGLVAGVLTVQVVWSRDRPERSQVLIQYGKAAAIAAGVFAALTGLTWLLCDLNLVTVWSWNYHNHAAFYDEYSRTYWKWLLVAPVELCLAVGLPVVVAAVAALRRTTVTAPALAAFGVIVLLWVSGKNSGEAARLWLFLMPWVLWLAASVWSGERGSSRWHVVFPAQLAASLLTAVRISGFGFEEYLRSIGA